MLRGYADRLTADSYRDDFEFELRLQPDPREKSLDPVVERIPERLLARLRYLALAYELPALGRLPREGSMTYSEPQLDSVDEELAFLLDVVPDEVLVETVSPLLEMIETAKHDPGGWSLTVDAP